MVYFKVKRKSTLKKLMDVYAERQGGASGPYRFVFDGERIGETMTPDDVCAACSCHVAAQNSLSACESSGDTAACLTSACALACSLRWRTATPWTCFRRRLGVRRRSVLGQSIRARRRLGNRSRTEASGGCPV